MKRSSIVLVSALVAVLVLVRPTAVLGTVPIEAVGSVAFHAPSGISLHFQLLDERQRGSS